MGRKAVRSSSSADELDGACVSGQVQADASPASARRQWYRCICVILITGCLLGFITELLNHNDLKQIWLWLSDYPVIVALNLGLFVAFTGMLLMLLNRPDRACQAATLLLLLPLASNLKQRFLMQPLLPSDLVMAGENALVLLRFADPLIALGLALVTAVVIYSVGAVLRRICVVRVSTRWRLVGGLGLMIVPVGLCAVPDAWLTRVGLDCHFAHGSTTQSDSYMKNGFLVSFLVEANPNQPAPPGYSHGAMMGIVAHLPDDAPPPPPAVRPDIVAILSESFWDPTEFPGVTFSADPVPVYHALRKETRDLRFLSPVFGGGTANVEFELLTGFSMYHSPDGDTPYDHLPNTPVPSVVRFLAANGYATKAIHTYSRQFYFRDMNYPRLGFQSYDGDESFPPEAKKGMYLSDAALGVHAMRELKNARQPLFLFLITMQNHGPFRAGRYGSSDVRLSSGLDPFEQEILRTYTQGVHDADAMLGEIVSYLRTCRRPTIVIYFGDHLPVLGENLALYRHTGLIQDGTTRPERLKLHTTPAIVWANYPLNLPRYDEIISPALIWSEVLPAIGMQHRFYTHFLGELRSKVTGLSRNVCVKVDGEACDEAPADAQSILDTYRLIQYDLLNGHQYSQIKLFGIEQFLTPHISLDPQTPAAILTSPKPSTEYR